jgi:precorrin-6Y C5,15-methyltransferase (decarboxylating)
MHYIVVGISNNSEIELNDEVKSLLPVHKIFSGHKRHYEVVKDFLPANHRWIEIKNDMQQVVEEYKKSNESVVVFTSGDPLFYGFANTLKKLQPEVILKVYPYFNSLQLLCHKCNIAYQNSWNTSVHGRPWDELDVALIYQKELIGVLTDAEKNPALIAQRMLTYGFDNYKIIVGEALESKAETIKSLSLQHAANTRFNPLNSVLLIKTSHRKKAFGIPDDDFDSLETHKNMIIPRAVRLMNLSQLDLYNRKTFWDLGFGSGSMSIEAKKQFPFLDILAFEKRQECDDVFETNARKHSTPGIMKVMADITDCELDSLTIAPEAVFINQQKNKLVEVIRLLDKHLLPKARIVMNVENDEGKKEFIEIVQQLNYNVMDPILLKMNAHGPAMILTAEKGKLNIN